MVHYRNHIHTLQKSHSHFCLTATGIGNTEKAVCFKYALTHV